MTTKQSSSKAQRKRLVLILALVCAAAFAAVIILLVQNPSAPPADGKFHAELETALAGADEYRGAELSEAYECELCHWRGDGSTAPLYDGLADVAGQRRENYSAEQYLYEAIVYPAAHLVEGYTDAMPANYGERLTTEEIGHIIAYLLTFSDET